jgi:uncharacterized cupin superfamily protein
MVPNKILRIEAGGPAGALPPQNTTFPAHWMATEQPVKHRHGYIDDVGEGITCGVWQATPFTMTPHLYSINEFMLVLQGSVTLVNTGGGETTVRAGDSFVVPQGWDGYWKQLEFFRKFAFSFRNPSWRKPADPTALKIVKLDHKARLEPCQPPPAELLSGQLPMQHAHEWFVDVSGQLAVGVHDTTAFHQKPVHSPRHDWRHVLEGSVSLTDEAGKVHRFVTGDTFVVPLGVVCDWRCDDHLRTVYCTFQPNGRRGAPSQIA